MSAFVLFTALIIAVPDRPGLSPRSERPIQDELLGRWTLTRRGNADARPNELQMEFSPDTMRQYTGAATTATSFSYKLDLGKRPVIIDFHPTRTKGILKIEGDVLTMLLISGNVEPFPTQFETPPGSNFSLLQLTRTKQP